MSSPTGFQLKYFDNAADFLTLSRSFLEDDEAAYGLMLGLAETALAKKAVVNAWAVLKGAELQFAIFQTPPHNLIVTAAPDLSVVDFAARRLAQHDRALDFLGVVGPIHESDVFKETWSLVTGDAFRLGFRQRIHKATTATIPNISGLLVEAKPADLDLIAEWTYAFAKEALPKEPTTIEKMRALTEARLPVGGIYLWVEQGVPVSQAWVSRPTRHGISVNMVYTPEKLRGQGYASAVVAALTDLQLKTGREFCVLFTDLGNPTSNSIYRKIGYRPVADSVHWIRS